MPSCSHAESLASGQHSERHLQRAMHHPKQTPLETMKALTEERYLKEVQMQTDAQDLTPKTLRSPQQLRQLCNYRSATRFSYPNHNLPDNLLETRYDNRLPKRLAFRVFAILC